MKIFIHNNNNNNNNNNNTLCFILLAFFLLPCTIIARSCRDDPDFAWPSSWKNKKRTLTCKFLTASKIEGENITRQTKWCNRIVKGSVLRDKCKSSCKQCGGEGVGSLCSNRPRNWTDNRGNGCDWYARGDSIGVDRCEMFGDKRANNGMVANNVCCACGAGKFRIGNRVCFNVEGWHERGYPKYDCRWYQGHPKFYCAHFGSLHPYMGMTAKDACCVCKNEN